MYNFMGKWFKLGKIYVPFSSNIFHYKKLDPLASFFQIRFITKDHIDRIDSILQV